MTEPGIAAGVLTLIAMMFRSLKALLLFTGTLVV